MQRSVALLLVAVLPLFVVLSACDSGGSSNSVDNQFQLTIQQTSSSAATVPLEAAQDQVNGYSFFYDAENPQTGEKVFGIYLNDSDSFSQQKATTGLFGYIARKSGRPGSGTYNFSDTESGLSSSQFVAVLWRDFTNQQSEPFYVIRSGTLSIDESSNDKVSGSIEAQGTAFTFSGSTIDTSSVQISGQFTAEDVETFVGFNSPGT